MFTYTGSEVTMSRNRRLQGWRGMASLMAMGTVFQFGSCDLGEFQSTSTVTLSGREVVSFLVRSWVLTPIENAIDTGVERFFDRFDDEDDD
jgi:hypothetical protein